MSTSRDSISGSHFVRWVYKISEHGFAAQAFVCSSHHARVASGDPDGSFSTCRFPDVFATPNFQVWPTDFIIFVFFRGFRIFDFYVVDCCDVGVASSSSTDVTVGDPSSSSVSSLTYLRRRSASFDSATDPGALPDPNSSSWSAWSSTVRSVSAGATASSSHLPSF